MARGKNYTNKEGIEFVKNNDGSTLRTSRGRRPEQLNAHQTLNENDIYYRYKKVGIVQ
jgi:hypothetical protein